ncbi:CynX/NimT family MFS transporter [Lederbergia lenta]|uniref:Major facilitator superfamily protein n=1 Tax=Lederbergia lenta TaxID=1467 RepID=A0A2X4VUE4_LEDLE|nr:MFS transporter [Lederbergia lenta]MEC2323776.1 MFS transporter [Lederbergia lenta]SQI51458.1 major facilitator superfamily protein [Lederbergia lenta]
MAVQQSVPTSKKIKFSRHYWLLIIGIVFIASTLRSPLTSVGPLISSIRASLDVSNVLAGFLTTIPLLAFALISPFAPKLARRFGLEKTLFASLCLLTLGIVIRSLGTTPYLLIGTFLLGLSIAFGNVLLPGLIKLNFPLHIGLLTGVYSVSMNLSGAVAAGISVPLASGVRFGWEGALGCWALLSLIAAIIWLPQLKGKKRANVSTIPAQKQQSLDLWRSPLAWNITLFMGLQSLIFYTTSAWLPEVLKVQGVHAGQAGWMLSLMQFAQLPMTFIIPVIAGQLKDQRILVLLTSAFFLIGFGGILIGEVSLIPLWMILLGIAGGSAFGLAMMFFTLRTNTSHEAAELSGMAQSFGYTLAAIGPVLFGFLHDVTASWSIPLSLFFIATIALFISGMRAGKKEFIVSPEGQ